MNLSYTLEDEVAVKKVPFPGNNLEIREAFCGVTFVTEDGERLTVSMRDSGFEAHYYGDIGRVGFDAGWFRFNDGTVNDDKAEPDEPSHTLSPELTLRMEAWEAATQIVNEIVEKHPLKDFRGASMGPLVSGPMFTEAEQRMNMITEVASWLLNEEMK